MDAWIVQAETLQNSIVTLLLRTSHVRSVPIFVFAIFIPSIETARDTAGEVFVVRPDTSVYHKDFHTRARELVLKQIVQGRIGLVEEKDAEEEEDEGRPAAKQQTTRSPAAAASSSSVKEATTVARKTKTTTLGTSFHWSLWAAVSSISRRKTFEFLRKQTGYSHDYP